MKKVLNSFCGTFSKFKDFPFYNWFYFFSAREKELYVKDQKLNFENVKVTFYQRGPNHSLTIFHAKSNFTSVLSILKKRLLGWFITFNKVQLFPFLKIVYFLKSKLYLRTVSMRRYCRPYSHDYSKWQSQSHQLLISLTLFLSININILFVFKPSICINLCSYRFK